MNDRIEVLILSNILHNETFSRKVLPFISSSYFNEPSERLVYQKISDFILKYGTLPTKEAICISITNDEKLTDTLEKQSKDVVTLLSDGEVDFSWLVDQTETWCKDRAIYLALMDSIKIADDKKGKLSRGSIPKLLTDALSVSFDPNVGHNYLDDTDFRFDFYHTVEEKLPFDLECMNEITKGGVPRKTLNVLLAGCVHPNTKVRVRFRKRSSK